MFKTSLWDFVNRAADDAAASPAAPVAPAGDGVPSPAPAGAAAHQAASDAGQTVLTEAAKMYEKPADKPAEGATPPAAATAEGSEATAGKADAGVDPAAADPLEALKKAVTDAKTPDEKKTAETALNDAALALPFDPGSVALPDGVAIDQPLMDQFVPVAKELGLDRKGGQKIVDQYVKIRQREATEFAETVSGWLKDAKADKDYGGEKWGATQRSAQMAVEKLGDASLKEALDNSGLGNHPAMIKFAARAGELIRDDKPVVPLVGGPGAKLSKEEEHLAILYPQSTG